MNVLEFDSIELSFNGRQILKNIFIQCNTGKITGLLGRNGAGKSCLMQVVFGGLQAQYKSVRFNGTYLQKQIIAYLPQTKLLPSYISLSQALKLFQVQPLSITEYFPEINLIINKKPDEISTGELRVFEVLLILNSRHPFCFLDEPFSGLSPVMIDRLKSYILLKKQYKGILISDHLHQHVTGICDEIFVLSAGQSYRVKSKADLIGRGYLPEV
ncbi:MAG TPA: ATP-binding cassette domain-containing protein [Cyclobacteriaceae bacterium]|nr:ATP-binding cassette domain-containing protein [Cyclobacteriaceae bacterium]